MNMDLKIFAPEDLATKQTAFLSISKTNYMRFNQALKNRLGLKHGDVIKMAQDQDNPKDWFLLLNQRSGFELRAKDDEDKGLMLQSSSLVAIMRESLGMSTKDKSVRFLVAEKPVSDDNPYVYAILTAKPL